MKTVRKWLCDYLGWHKWNGAVTFDGCSFVSRCKHCNKEILRDSQGNWFAKEQRERR